MQNIVDRLVALAGLALILTGTALATGLARLRAASVSA